MLLLQILQFRQLSWEWRDICLSKSFPGKINFKFMKMPLNRTHRTERTPCSWMNENRKYKRNYGCRRAHHNSCHTQLVGKSSAEPYIWKALKTFKPKTENIAVKAVKRITLDLKIPLIFLLRYFMSYDIQKSTARTQISAPESASNETRYHYYHKHRK